MNQPREPHPLIRLFAVTSRTQATERLAMDQLRQAGGVVTGTETVLFPLLRTPTPRRSWSSRG